MAHLAPTQWPRHGRKRLVPLLYDAFLSEAFLAGYKMGYFTSTTLWAGPRPPLAHLSLSDAASDSHAERSPTSVLSQKTGCKASAAFQQASDVALSSRPTSLGSQTSVTAVTSNSVLDGLACALSFINAIIETTKPDFNGISPPHRSLELRAATKDPEGFHASCDHL